jgi:hypothetical protein
VVLPAIAGARRAIVVARPAIVEARPVIVVARHAIVVVRHAIVEARHAIATVPADHRDRASRTAARRRLFRGPRSIR